jgi:hypothetical protein
MKDIYTMKMPEFDSNVIDERYLQHEKHLEHKVPPNDD